MSARSVCQWFSLVSLLVSLSLLLLAGSPSVVAQQSQAATDSAARISVVTSLRTENSLSPQVVAVGPPRNALNVSPSANITATFNMAMNASTVTTRTMVTYGAQTGRLPATVTYNDAAPTGTLDPAGFFKPGEVVWTSMTSGTLGTDGTPITPTVWQFTTRSVSATASFTEHVTYTVGTQPEWVAVGDLNGDGYLDLVVANAADSTISVLLNYGDGTFAPQVLYTAGSYPDDVTVGDLDADGDLDLAVANWTSNNVSVLRNRGDGTFSPQTAYPVGTNPLQVITADLDGDGDLDLVTANNNSANVSVLRNRGDGTFDPQTTYSAMSSPHSVAAGDFNGDGTLDLAVVNCSSNNVSVLLNRGNGSFLPQVAYTVGTGPWTVASGDLDRDGDLDLIVTNEQGANVSVLRNNGNGTFATQVSYAAGTWPSAAILADLDGDGNLDIATTNGSSHDVSVLRGNGDGTFAAQVKYVLGNRPFALAVGDMDGDGDLDLVSSNYNGNIIWVLRNGVGYSISGRVTDGNSPISGVTISTDAGHSATTNATGYYTITNLITGTYTVVPSKSSYTFSPASRTVTVPPDAMGQDFTGRLGTDNRILFTSDRGGNGAFEIFVMNDDGTNQVNLTNNPANDSEGDWSPDGTRIVLWSSRDGNAEIYVMNADGSNLVRLTNNPADDVQPAWSSDGTRIAFVSNRDGARAEIYVMNTDGSNFARLTYDQTENGVPSWSPDSTRIAFQKGIDSGREIYVMNADGTNPIRLTNNSVGDGDPAWSPDGTRIAFTSERDGNREIYVMNADGSNPVRLTNNPAWDEYPSWSPDGTRIVFTSMRDGNREVYVMNTDGSEQTRLTYDPFADWYPAWRPWGGITYSISGQVADSSGNPISSATISDGAGHSATTDGNGYYTLSGLAAGTYTLTPGKSGYTFTPASRTVTVPPDATGQGFTGAPELISALTLTPLYPPVDQSSRVMRGGIAHRYFEVRDAVGQRAPSVTVTFSPSGSGSSDASGLLDVSVTADSLGGPGSYTLTATGASRWGQSFALASPVSFALEVQERPFQHHWYGGTVGKAKGGISVGLVAFLEGELKGGLGWNLTETDAQNDSDDILRLAEQFQGEVGGGAGLGAQLSVKGLISSAEAGAEATSELKGLAQGEWQSRFDAPYTPPDQKAQAVFVLSGLMDIVPVAPGAPALAAILRALTPGVAYESYREKTAAGIGAEWTPGHLHAGAEIKFLGIGGDGKLMAQEVGMVALAPNAGLSSPLLKLDALDTETTLRLFGTLTTDDVAHEWSLALEQEVGFDLDLLTVQTPVTQKIGVYVGDRSTKLKEELFFSQSTGDPVRFELSLTGEGNAMTFSDIVLRDVTYKFIVEGADLELALQRVRNLTALVAAWDALQSQGLIAGSSAALQEVNAYLTSVPLSRYEVTAATDGTLEVVPEVGWSGILDIELGAGVEFKQGREIVIERGYATAGGLLATEVYPDRQYGSQAGKSFWDLLGNALTGARLIVESLFWQVVQTVQQGIGWTVDIVGRTVDDIVRGGAQLIGGGGMTYRAAALDGALLAPTEAFTLTATAWVPMTGSPAHSRLLSASGEGFAVGGVYQFSPYTMTLTPPATLVITYTAEAAGAADPNLFRLYRWRPEEANWQPFSATHDLPARAMTTTIGQLGTYVIGYDVTPPTITMLQPTAVVSQTHLPQFTALITDTGSGIAPASVAMLLVDQPVSTTYAPLSGYLWYTATAFLPNGAYTYTVTAADTAGNLAIYSGAFTVSVPAPAVLGVDPWAVPHGITATVAITGQNFAYPPVVQVDSTVMADVGYLGLTAVSVTLPITLAQGLHDVAVAAPDGQSGTKAAAFAVVEPAALTPLTPTVSISRTIESIRLTWPHRTQSVFGYPAVVARYEIWRSAAPYFSPGDVSASLIAEVTPPPWIGDGQLLAYDDTTPVDAGEQRFYRVRAVSVYGLASSASNGAWLFSFSLTPGDD
jgi:Tol biopolymer transport system component